MSHEELQWTPEEEEAFQEMTTRRISVLKWREECLRKAMFNVLVRVPGDDIGDALLNRLIDNAGPIRDALLPWDSNGRPSAGSDK